MRHTDRRWWDEHAKRRQTSQKPAKKPAEDKILELVKRIAQTGMPVNREMKSAVPIQFTRNEVDIGIVKELVSKYTLRNYRYPMKISTSADYFGVCRLYFSWECNDRDTGEPTSVGMYRSVESHDEHYIRSLITSAIKEFVLHEMDECLCYDGRRLNDPHRYGF